MQLQVMLKVSLLLRLLPNKLWNQLLVSQNKLQQLLKLQFQLLLELQLQLQQRKLLLLLLQHQPLKQVSRQDVILYVSLI